MADELVVYGANGATGSRFVEVAAAAGLHPVVAGRDRAALESVAAPFGLEVRVAELDALDAAFAGAAVVVSCVAPYTTRGIPVLEAALRAGAHHVDCTGEPRFVARLIQEFDAPARSAGVAVVPAAGIGTVANLTAHAAVGGVPQVEALTVDYLVRGMRPSAGTASSTVRLLAGGAAVATAGGVAWEPPGSKTRSLARGAGALFPLTDALTLARQWPQARVETYVQSRTPRLLGACLRLGSRLGRTSALPDLVARAGRRLDRPAGPRPKGRFTVTVEAQGAGHRAVAVSEVPDIYEVTSQAAFEIAQSLLQRQVAPGFRASGEVIGDPHEVAGRIGVALRVV